MTQKTEASFDVRAVAAHRLHLIVATVCIVAVLGYWMYWFLSSTAPYDDARFFIANMVIGLVGIWVLIAGILLQVAMRIKTSTIVLTAFVAFLAPYVTGIFLITQSSIKLIHARRDS